MHVCSSPRGMTQRVCELTVKLFFFFQKVIVVKRGGHTIFCQWLIMMSEFCRDVPRPEFACVLKGGF